MKVKDVIISALNLLGRAELASSLSNGITLDSEGTETVNSLLYCFNAVEDEVARKYMPLSCTDTVVSIDGDFYYITFSHSPVKIKSVTVDGEKIQYQLFAEYMRANSKKITVEYEYAPTKKKIDGTSDFGNEVGEYLLANGVAAEYCLINGEIEAAEIWENRYRKEIDIAQSNMPSGGYIPPRRWV